MNKTIPAAALALSLLIAGCIPAAPPPVPTYNWYADLDGDGYGNPQFSKTSATKPVGYVRTSGDCDDRYDSSNPGATEELDDGRDNDCDGQTDDLWFQDEDGDSFGSLSALHSAIPVPGYSVDTGDCDDADAAVSPAATENFADGKDNDCDGLADNTWWFGDLDGDGFGDLAVITSAAAKPAGYVSNAGDCDDADSAVKPGANETMGNNKDDDCDGLTDDLWFQDIDNDRYGNPVISQHASSRPPGYSHQGGDCDDTRSNINPGAPEIADGSGVDEDCNGVAE